jgi:chromosome segregation ATPase
MKYTGELLNAFEANECRLERLDQAIWSNWDRIDALNRELDPNEHNLELCYIRDERLQSLVERCDRRRQAIWGRYIEARNSEARDRYLQGW